MLKKVSEDKLLKIAKYHGWDYICWNYILPEPFIEKYIDKFDDYCWSNIINCQCLSEKFINKHINVCDDINVYLKAVVSSQKLSEKFLEKYIDVFNEDCEFYWYRITNYQKLSESFINRHIDKFDSDCWENILKYQKLSEEFLEKYIDKLTMYQLKCLLVYQKLSESFIEKYINKFDMLFWKYILKYQNLSKIFIKKHKADLKPWIYLIKNLWQYKSTEYKKQQVIDTGLYECYDDYFIAYKGIRADRYSAFNFQYQYLSGQTYETFADYSCDENSFGFSVWTEEKAKDYCDELVIKVKIYYNDVARVVHNGGKIRCCRMTVLN